MILLGIGHLAAAQEGPAGRTLFIESDRIDLKAFESSSPIRVEEEPKVLTIFPQADLPSDYDTPYKENGVSRHLKIVRPYDEAAFPVNLAPPKFRWEDRTDNLWMLSVRAPGWTEPLRVVTGRKWWRPDFETWAAIKKGASEGWVELEVRGCVAKGKVRLDDEVYVDSVRFRISPYPTDPIIVYRMVSPLFHGFKTPDIYYREVSNFKKGMFLPGKGIYCTNCHVFPGNPDLKKEDLKLAVAVREQLDKAGRRRRFLGLYDFTTKEGNTLNINSSFMGWDPDGKKIAITHGKHIFSLPGVTLETQEFYVVVADIAILDAETLEVESLPGAATPENMETFPAWSPDSKTIIFSRAPELDIKKGVTRAKFDLYTVPYNDGAGGEAKPVPGAAHNGMSNFQARFSADGKWICFNKAKWASLIKPSADLWIVSTEEGAMPRLLECNVDYAMDSYHSWSSNSRWLVFTTKRDDGIFTKIYLTEIDEEGHASPPVELPTLEESMLCYNIPEFLKYKVTIDADDILEKTSNLED